MQGKGGYRVHTFKLLPTHSYNATLKGNQSKVGTRLLLIGSLSGMKKQTYTPLVHSITGPVCFFVVALHLCYVYRAIINSLVCWCCLRPNWHFRVTETPLWLLSLCAHSLYRWQKTDLSRLVHTVCIGDKNRPKPLCAHSLYRWQKTDLSRLVHSSLYWWQKQDPNCVAKISNITSALFLFFIGKDRTDMAAPKLQALVYDILPSTTAVFSYVIVSMKTLVGAQTVVSLLQTQIKQGVSFTAANKVYTSSNKTTIVWIDTELFFFTRGGCVSCLRGCLGARLFPQSY